MSGEFYPGGSTLPGPMPSRYWTGEDFTKLREACNDLRTGLTVARSARLAQLGIWVGTSEPATAITYAQWIAGGDGYWAWIDIS